MPSSLDGDTLRLDGITFGFLVAGLIKTDKWDKQ
jgi:hypothetical protein